MDTTSSFAGSPSSLAVNCEDTHEVQTVRVVPDSGSLDSLHCYRLRLSHNGLTTTTGKVPVTATAMSADEVDGSVLERGLLFGGSIQGHLEALKNVGTVAVRRLGDATDGHPTPSPSTDVLQLSVYDMDPEMGSAVSVAGVPRALDGTRPRPPCCPHRDGVRLALHAKSCVRMQRVSCSAAPTRVSQHVVPATGGGTGGGATDGCIPPPRPAAPHARAAAACPSSMPRAARPRAGAVLCVPGPPLLSPNLPRVPRGLH